MRNFPNWLRAYCDYASFSEAPTHMHFWSGVSAIAGALRRHVWIDQGYFRWHTNHYIVFVAPPGIVSKSTTVAIAMDILRKVPGINFGPDVVTWPALVQAFAAVSESFEITGEWIAQCALTLESSEFGNLVNPQDRDMIDLLVTLWDSKTGALKKVTKGCGSDTVENPWINLIACTTPAWIAGNFPEYIIGGGFTSRCLFVYADKKQKLVPYPALVVPSDLKNQQTLLAQDLEHIATNLLGGYQLSPEATAWGEAWYTAHYETQSPLSHDDRFGGYLARKQTHIHKLAMVIAASERDELVILPPDLELALRAVEHLEEDMPKVFSKIGRTNDSIQVERFIRYVQQLTLCDFESAYRHVHSYFSDPKQFALMVEGAAKAGYVQIVNTEKGMMLAPGAIKI